MSELRHFSSAFEFPHSLAFCHCLATELGRLTTLESSHQKSKFIGSVSHELRSPLHGILASCDFIGETECSPFQKSMIDTASGCARTLMDTIDMVLDYSKINTFERDWRNVCNGSHGKSRQINTGSRNASMNIYSLVNIATIVEEVVEGSVTGYAVFDNSKLMTSDIERHSPYEAGGNLATESMDFAFGSMKRPEVEVIIDIPPMDWTYVTQPGGFRRILMNLVGNALKYTKHGFVRVELDAVQQDHVKHSSDDDEPTSTITMKVIDSGCGISPEYLRTKLFTPFSQENILAPGTGLGLSLVKSIVSMLGGDIDVQSQVSVGTQVTVQLPMRRQQKMPLTSPACLSDEHAQDTSIERLREQSRGHRVAYFWRDATEDVISRREATQAASDKLKEYLKDFFGEAAVSGWTPGCDVSLVVVDECDLHALLAAERLSFNDTKASLTLILCGNGLRQRWLRQHTASECIEVLSKPFGPNKLARTIRQCLERVEALR